MKKLLELLGFLLILQGLGAVLHALFGWFEVWGLIRRVGLLSGYELYAGVAVLVLGLAMCAFAERGRS